MPPKRARNSSAGRPRPSRNAAASRCGRRGKRSAGSAAASCCRSSSCRSTTQSSPARRSRTCWPIPASFEGETLADPLEGVEYGRCKAKIMRRADGTPWINSFAHGRTVYELKLDAAGDPCRDGLRRHGRCRCGAVEHAAAGRRRAGRGGGSHRPCRRSARAPASRAISASNQDRARRPGQGERRRKPKNSAWRSG